ncbi:hypothetical protein HER14_06465 [Acidithiobacillus thiooxidans]|jgi:uncharacterized protein YbjQ (UPF0145 family)|uniref:Heavy metal-binding domain-containing protein n=2 Tax=Acidithiobacillus thiooxidans TaxID=930 RepID=A0A1C2IZR6_ACITH|nr:hypothetical protein [Acidithiobacillus thiooxidans]MBU2750594.1 hypothetical protein [Acidithiobacillus thiooxidans]MBU2836247.1 hypothetical protein [Acidithiobacillus thiooxidans]OCX67504.1 hypothetical protein A6P07_19945 [Acidithiobacillus thiooxidans]OCX73128.1 hypothetical protein A6O24_12500 [Acidithiobacillus thiooxidans]OCX81526.1 hypothetical protein A6O26_13105 [Acidithiobacillus thiooxidans]
MQAIGVETSTTADIDPGFITRVISVLNKDVYGDQELQMSHTLLQLQQKAAEEGAEYITGIRFMVVPSHDHPGVMLMAAYGTISLH